ncbi:MAG TPA: alkaline phosphatase family protein, partial [Ktedonobacterales bacterium]
VMGLPLLLAGCASTSSPTTPAAYAHPKQGPAHIFVVVMENHATDQIVGNTADAPYITQLAAKYDLAKQYYGVTHPSLPNYLALISGDTQGIFDDCAPGAFITCPPEEFQANSDLTPTQLLTADQEANSAKVPHLFSTQTIVDQLEAQHLTWKGYMESMPGVAYTGDANAHQLYRAKHNPFVYFQNIIQNPKRAANIVPATQLANDLSADRVPNFVFLAPNQCNDMHGLAPANAAAENIPTCGYPASGLDHGAIQLGDKYLSTLVPQIMGSKAWSEGSVLAIVWDEDDYKGYAGCCHSPVGVNGTLLGGSNAPAIFISSKGSAPVSDDTTKFNHYSLLATIEKVWGLPCLANTCGFKDEELMSKFFAA